MEWTKKKGRAASGLRINARPASAGTSADPVQRRGWFKTQPKPAAWGWRNRILREDREGWASDLGLATCHARASLQRGHF